MHYMEHQKNRMNVLVLSFAVVIIVATQHDHDEVSSTVIPKNVCAVPGDKAELQCSLPEAIVQYWMRSPQNYISTNKKVEKDYRDKYDITGKYYLSILKFGFNDAGTYGCVDGTRSNQTFKAEVIVLENSLHITSNTTCNVILENKTIRYTCQIRYDGNITPSMRWTLLSEDNPNSTGINCTSTNESDVAKTYIDVTGDTLKNGNRYICTSFLEAPVVPDNFTASNAPGCHMTTKSEILTVHYKPRNTTITLPTGEIVDSNATVHIGDVLKCQTKSNPKHVTYEWSKITEMESKILGHSQNLTLNEEDLGIASIKCKVTNTMGCNSDTEGSDTIVVNLNVTGDRTVPHEDNELAHCKGSLRRRTVGFVVGIVMLPLACAVLCIIRFCWLKSRNNSRQSVNNDPYKRGGEAVELEHVLGQRWRTISTNKHSL